MTGQMRAAWALLKKDLAVWLRNPVALFTTLLPPLVLLLILGLAAAAVTTLPVAVVNRDGGEAAAVMERTALSFAGFRAQVMSPGQAAKAFDDLDVAAVLTIPRGFSTDLAQGRRPELEWHVRNFNADAADDLHRDMATVVEQFLATGAGGPDPVHITVAERDVHPRDADFVAFMIVAVLGMLIVQAGVVNAGQAAAKEWETGAVKELLLSPARPLTVIAGKVAAGVVLADCLAGLVAAAAMAAGFLPRLTPGGVGLALAAMTLLALFGSGLGVAVAALARTAERIAPLAINLSFYLFFLAGGIAALAYLPAWLRAVARAIPNSYAVHVLRGALLYRSYAGAGGDLLALAVAAAVGLAVGVPVLRRGLAH